MTLAIPINEQAINQLNTLAQSKGISAEELVADIVTRYLEDAEDIAAADAAMDALEQGEETLIAWDTVKKRLDL